MIIQDFLGACLESHDKSFAGPSSNDIVDLRQALEKRLSGFLLQHRNRVARQQILKLDRSLLTEKNFRLFAEHLGLPLEISDPRREFQSRSELDRIFGPVFIQREKRVTTKWGPGFSRCYSFALLTQVLGRNNAN